MCEPVTTGLMIAAAAFSAYGQMQQAESAAKASEYSQKVAQENAKAAEMQAKDSENRGANEAATQRENYLRANATARAQAGSTGLLADKGTMGQIQDQNAELGEMNVLTARNNAAREAWGYRVQATNYTNQAAAEGFAAKSSRYNGMLGAGATFASGVANAAGKSKWLQKQFGGDA